MSRFRPVFLTLLLASWRLAAQIPGQNVNMVSGTQWPTGDPFLQRQNEPSMAVSSRNPLHLLGGANDYRTVDLPGLPNGETGDAWLGVFKSYDGGATWTSTVHPGCPQNLTQCGGAPLLKGYAAAADPVVRAGSNGMFYYSGIVFSRTANSSSAVFVSRFIDNNNEENGDPIKYVSSVPVAKSTGSVFVDKPWLAVDVPRPGAGNCTITAPQTNGPSITQTFPAGNVYVAYTTFANEQEPPSQIWFVRSRDCGATWSAPLAISDANVNQGASIAIDPVNGTVYVAWRRFANGNLLDSIMLTVSRDGGQTFSAPQQVVTINPFDQGTTDFSFRTNDYPTTAVDAAGNIYIAWSERGLGTPNSGGDARIAIISSADGQNWTPRQAVDNYDGRGHQFMPAMTFAGGRLMIVYYDLRDDTTLGLFTPTSGGQYVETRQPQGDLATTPPHPEKVFTSYVLDAAPANLNEGGLLWRHTVDVRAAEADTGVPLYFNTTRVSQYEFGSLPNSTIVQQLKVNPPNFPMFSQGTVPFAGDYLDVAASPWIIPGSQAGTWRFNTDPSPSIAFHAVWADNRDVVPPANGDWTDYTPPISASTSGTSLYDPTKPQPVCVVGQTSSRNENIYTSLITQGLFITSPSNSKTLGAIQRAFPVVVANSTNLTKAFRLTIMNQPPGGKASFLEFPTTGLPDPLVVLDISIPPISSASRMVFVTSNSAAASVLVNVAEILGPGAAVVAGGLSGSLLLNPDPLNPVDSNIQQTEIFNPSIASPSIASPNIASPSIASPSIASPSIASPSIASPSIASLDLTNPSIASTVISNPSIASPSIASPSIASPSIASASITDVSYPLVNNGNATGTYSLHFLVNGTIGPTVIPQLIVNLPYYTPAAIGCNLVTQNQTVVLANNPHPQIVSQQSLAASALGRMLAGILRHGRARANGGRISVEDASNAGDVTDDSADNTTITIGPGETVYVTLRFFNTDKTQPLGFDPGTDLTVISISQSTNTGGTQPPIASSKLIAVSSGLPAGISGQPYDATLEAGGGTTPYTWTVIGGNLPPGLTLSANGEISGTVSGSAGTYNFQVQVADSANPSSNATESLSITVSSVSLALSGITATGSGGGGSLKAGDSVTLTASVVNSGSAADAVTPVVATVATGTASAGCGGGSPPSANLPTGGSQTYTFQCGPVSGSGTLAFSVAISATDHLTGAGISVSPGTSNVLDVLGAPPVVTVTASAGGGTYTSGTWTNQDVTVMFTCTPAFGLPSTQSITVNSQGANQTVSTTCTDQAGNSTPASFSGIDIDQSPPLLTASETVNGAPYSGGIINQSVLVTFNCTDPGGSGVATVTPPLTFSGGGLNQMATGTCVDRAGNSSTLTIGNINIINQPPQISVTLTANGQPYTPGSWSATPVTVTFNCTPAQGGSILTFTQPVILSQGANQLVNGSCTDLAGNSVRTSAGPINVNTGAPTITQTYITPNLGSWYNGPVSVTWQCVDRVDGTNYTISKTITTQGAGQSVTATCTNLAGTSVTASASANIDLTPPVITGSASPAPGGSGWNTSPVTVTFQCTDALSGVAAGYPTGNTTVTGDIKGGQVTGTCRDVAGNIATSTVTPINIDRTPPTISFVSAQPVNGAGWANGPVTVTWSCFDTGSGPVSPSVQQIVSGNGRNLSASATCYDLAGNSASNTHTGININTISPFVQLISPFNGITYPLNTRVVANYTCSPGGSGVTTSCQGTLPSGSVVPTGTPGTFSFTVTSTDIAGNTTSATNTYCVQACGN